MRLASNYSEANYESLRAKRPNWPIYGSETSENARGHGALTTILKENGQEATKKTANYEQIRLRQ